MFHPDLDTFDFSQWLECGIENGWIAAPTCYNHDSLPMTEAEEKLMDEGDDPCMNVIRIWDV